jgi:hypothetical protein
MKFRRTCSVCNATFFSPDRKALYCLKCIKKRVVKHIPAEARQAVPIPRLAPRPVAHASAPVTAARKKREPRAPKLSELTPELKRRIGQIYEQEFADSQIPLRDVHSQIANKLWVKRQLVADVIKDTTRSKAVLTLELKERAIQMYQRFVETGHRPDGGRRRAISAALGIPYKQVMKLIREWSLAQYEASPTPTPSRQQLFEIEKSYWEELQNKRHTLTDLPEKISEQLGYVTRWQVLRWLDVLHDDERAFANVPEPAQDVQQQILRVYTEYLAAVSPPEHGLHYTIAAHISKVSPRQVHKVLQSFRHKMRSEYPLI